MGTTLTITGLNFSPVASNNIVYFGAVRAIVTAASATNLNVTVPMGATYAPITETVNGLTANSGQSFLPTFSGSGQITSASLGQQLVMPSGGTGPSRALIADVDGDGKPDLIVADGYSGQIAIFRNVGTNGFLATNSFATPVVLKTGTGTFGANPYTVVAADLDGDGRLDIVALNADSNVVSVFPNTSWPGNISFAPRIDLPAGNVLRGLAVEDLNGDGKPDIVTGNSTSPGTISVFQNLSTIGSIAFAPRVDFAAGNDPAQVVIGDVDGDGLPDIAVANGGDGTVSVFRNLGGGTITTNSFAPQVVFPAPFQCNAITIGDVDRDSKVDMLVAGNDGQLFVYRNTATAGSITTNSFAPPVSFPLGGRGHTIALGDLSGDGKPDVVVVTELNSLLSIFHNQSTPGSFTTNSLGGRVDFVTGYNAWGVSVGDLNGDGRQDIVFCNSYDNTISIYQNNVPPPTPPVITSFTPESGIVSTNVMITGLNFSPVASNNIVYFGAVRATVTTASPTNLTVTVPEGATFAPITETVNGLTAYSDQPFLSTFNGSGQINSTSLSSPLILPTGTGPSQVAVVDLDGDGKPDLVIPDAYAGDISIYQNISSNGTLVFAPRLVLPMIKGTYSNPWQVAVADVDGDGKPDIIALNSDSGLISIFRNVSSPGILTTNSFAPRIDILAATGTQDLAVRDLNGDGRPDIVTANGNNNSISIFPNQSTIGNISFAAPVNLAVSSFASDVAIADLDGDGNPDLVVLLMNNSSVSVFRNLGLGGTITTNSFAPQVIFPSAPNGRFLSIGDMDGDGKPDIVTANWTTETISVLRNLTSGPGITTNSFAPPVNFATGGWANNVTLGDLAGIGKLDIVAVSQLPSLFSIFQNISTPGSFTTSSLAPRVDFASGYNPNSATIADLNGDGRPDVVLANSYDNNIYILVNNVPTPTPPTITIEPQDAYVYAYGTASFSVGANGATSYQWLFNGSNVLNATSSTLTLSNIVQSQLGPYSVLVGNSYGSVTSSVANLYMYPSIVTPFTGVVTDWGQSNNLSVTAWGSGPLTYQWYDNGMAISNATNSTLTFSAIQFTNAGSYSVVVSSSLGSVTNAPAQVVINPAGVSLGLYPGITVTGTVGYTFAIQSNPDLTNTNGWTTVATLTLFQPVEFWVDVNNDVVTNQHRFYRVIPGQ